MKLSEIKELQSKLLRALIRRVYEKVPFYHKKLKEVGLTPDDVKSVEDLQKKKFFTVKDDLRANYPLGLLAVSQREVVRIHASSGTTGLPTIMAYTQGDIERWAELNARCLAVAGASQEDVVQVAYGYGLFTGGLGLHYGAEKLGAKVIPASVGNTKRQIKLMKDLKATVLCCTPSYALYIAEVAREEGVDPGRDLNLNLGIFGAEPWSEGTRKRIEEELDLRAHDIYGMSELYGPGVAIECVERNGLHVWCDHFIVEVIDPKTGEALEPGEEGELVFTTLTKEALPLIRYRSRDISILEEEPCSCGLEHPRIMRIRGRTDDMIKVRGVAVFPSQVEEVLSRIDGLAGHYQIIVDRDGPLDKLKVRVEVASSYVSDKLSDLMKLQQKVEEELREALAVRAEVELVEPKGLPRSEGKAQRVIDLRKV
ncbi:MAG: phenylacetate--CoA ligase [Candidatus Methanomethylicota archaeon]|uniref:Phenylacetate--CoA ligase n=1 Tax=Thermoproteota archaeon TaxID=2056631 RepID=A0A497ESX5_9CREN|nr:MAG: phenylacetate--CoA ligase [Candidatus Verstraetearchaeota archaeon]